MKFRGLIESTIKELEILGYTLALKKPIYFSELTNDIGLDSYITKIISLNKNVGMENSYC